MNVDFKKKDRYTAEDLKTIVTLLRGENGCPWDRAQDHHSIRNNFIEETYEAVEALDTENPTLLREELGDVLLQVLLHSEMEKEAGRFSFDDVVNDLAQKLVFRHPHVFGEVRAENAQDALNSWDAAKAQEKQQKTGTERLKAVSKSLPALMRSQKVLGRAVKAGMEDMTPEQALENLRQEIDGLERLLKKQDAEAVGRKTGDVLLAGVNVARTVKVEGEEVLSAACDRFVERFAAAEAERAEK